MKRGLRNVVATIRWMGLGPDVSDSARLGAWVAGFFAKRRQKWPTVRQAARGLSWTQARVAEATRHGGLLFRSRRKVEPVPLGDETIEHLELIQ